MDIIVLLVILIGLILYICHQEESYKKRITKEKTTSYLQGWNDASDALKSFDVNAYLDIKYEKSRQK